MTSTSKYVFDAFAWIEYFLATAQGKQVEAILEDKNTLVITPDCIVAEVLAWTLRENQDFPTLLDVMRARSKFLEINLNFWVEAAVFRHKMREEGRKNFGMTDALLLAVQQFSGANIVTGDPHFKGLKKITML